MNGPQPVEARFAGDHGWTLELDIENNWTHEFVHATALLEGNLSAVAPTLSASSLSDSGQVNPTLASQIAVHEIVIPEGHQRGTLTLEHDGATPQDGEFWFFPAGGDEDAWFRGDLDSVVEFGPRDLAMAGTWNWTLMVLFEPSLNTDVNYVWTLQSDRGTTDGWVTGPIAVPAASTGTVQWELHPADDMAETGVTMTIYVHATYDHDEPVEDDDVWLWASESASIFVANGVPDFVAPLEEAPDEDTFASAPGILAGLVALGLAATRRR